MAEESITEVKEIENCFVTNPPAKSEDGSMETLHENVISVVSKDQEGCTSVPKPQAVALRRYSTGTVGARASNKLQVQSRYRGDHHVASIHDLCKHGKKCDHDDAVKPWKMIGRRKSVEGSVTVKVESSSLKTKSLGSVSRQIPAGTKPESSVAAKRDALAVKRKPCASVNSESSSKDGSSVKSNDKAMKNQESAVVKKVPGLRNDKSNTNKEKVSRISAPKTIEKAKTQTISSEDVKEKTVCVVESSVKGVQSQKQPSSSKSLTTPKQTSGSLDLEENPKIKKKIRTKRTEVKVNLTKQLSFKRGKVLDPKPEDSSPKWIKFRKRVVQELKTQNEGRKKNLKGKRFDVAETKNDSCESSKREKVVLKHRQVEGKNKMMTLFNNVIEETVNKLTKVRKNKVKALIGAFETVISLQDTKTPHKVQSKATTTSASKVSPLASEQ